MKAVFPTPVPLYTEDIRALTLNWSNLPEIVSGGVITSSDMNVIGPLVTQTSGTTTTIFVDPNLTVVSEFVFANASGAVFAAPTATPGTIYDIENIVTLTNANPTTQLGYRWQIEIMGNPEGQINIP